jgi:hypothetical protein
MKIPAIGEPWRDGHCVRSGLTEDAAMIARWRSNGDVRGVRWALDEAITVLEAGSVTTTVYVIASPSPVGLLTIGASRPYLELVYVADAHRRAELGTRATSVVIAEFFARRTGEPWLGVTRPITQDGVRMLRRLGFWELDSGMQLTREAWEAQRRGAARRFESP